MSELERARAHLRGCQGILAFRRTRQLPIDQAEEFVLAALSWVNEEQEKENIERNANRFFRWIRTIP